MSLPYPLVRPRLTSLSENPSQFLGCFSKEMLNFAQISYRVLFVIENNSLSLPRQAIDKTYCRRCFRTIPNRKSDSFTTRDDEQHSFLYSNKYATLDAALWLYRCGVSFMWSRFCQSLLFHRRKDSTLLLCLETVRY